MRVAREEYAEDDAAAAGVVSRAQMLAADIGARGRHRRGEAGEGQQRESGVPEVHHVFTLRSDLAIVTASMATPQCSRTGSAAVTRVTRGDRPGGGDHIRVPARPARA